MKKESVTMPKQAQKAGPEGVRAVNAVTGGSPEDMNMMPPTYFPDEEGPVYDGSDLPRSGEAVENVPTEERDQTLEP